MAGEVPLLDEPESISIDAHACSHNRRVPGHCATARLCSPLPCVVSPTTGCASRGRSWIPRPDALAPRQRS
jgi:hypothetical protein